MDEHLVYVDDGPDAALHLTLECRRPGPASTHGVDPAACARALAARLDARAGRPWGEILVTTSRVHNGDMAPVLDVLLSRRPAVRRLTLGAITFPDFDRGCYLPDDPDRDGASWCLSVSGVDRLLTALPALASLVVQASAVDVTASSARVSAPRLRHLVLRADGLDPDCLSTLGRGAYPALTRLSLWLGPIAYGWGATVDALDAWLDGAASPALRHLTLVSDFDASLLEALARSGLLPRLSTLDLSHGVLGDDAALRIRDQYARFAHLDRLTLTGNAFTQTGAALLRGLPPNVVVGWQRHAPTGSVPFDPPRVSLFEDRDA